MYTGPKQKFQSTLAQQAQQAQQAKQTPGIAAAAAASSSSTAAPVESAATSATPSGKAAAGGSNQVPHRRNLSDFWSEKIAYLIKRLHTVDGFCTEGLFRIQASTMSLKSFSENLLRSKKSLGTEAFEHIAPDNTVTVTDSDDPHILANTLLRFLSAITETSQLNPQDKADLNKLIDLTILPVVRVQNWKDDQTGVAKIILECYQKLEQGQEKVSVNTRMDSEAFSRIFATKLRPPAPDLKSLKELNLVIGAMKDVLDTLYPKKAAAEGGAEAVAVAQKSEAAPVPFEGLNEITKAAIRAEEAKETAILTARFKAFKKEASGGGGDAEPEVEPSKSPTVAELRALFNS